MSGRGGSTRTAVAAYVRGHDRVWGVARMRGEPPSPEPPSIEWSGPPAAARFGVGVASEPEFHRGPGKGRGAAPSIAGGESHG